jgi:ribosomal protein S18 acetylase RimI-like enzyme
VGEVGGGEDDDYHYQNDDEYGGRSSSTRIMPLGEYWKREGLRLQQRRWRSDGGDDSRPRREIVGYVLGKVEERPRQRREYPPSHVAPPRDDEGTTLLHYLNNGNDPNNGRGVHFPSPRGQQQRNRRHRHPPPPHPHPPREERLGHVTSLAVRSHARRLGIASSLLRQLHYHLRECHGADSVGLHVRVSNEAAVRLYCAEGYDVADIMPLYYGDGE